MIEHFYIVSFLFLLVSAFSVSSTSPEKRGIQTVEVHWYGKAFKGVCPSTTYADSGIAIYVYTAITSSGPWYYKRTDRVARYGDYDVHFYQEETRPWVEFRTSLFDTVTWLKNNNCYPVRFYIKKEGIKNQDVVRGF
ncbi:MAG: hypothetical protein B5M53_02775 [Candidatus Cloacimonas sp. 4484_209]|nr:MAG: hypothetical protein B5M53_02775 [Candidatus Cloacimonas sp. 4484_209]